METRELYKQKYEAQLREWSAKLDALKAHTDKLTAEAKIEAKPKLDGMYGKLEMGRAKLRELTEATDDRWEEVTASAERRWNEIKAAIEGGYDALKPEQKG